MESTAPRTDMFRLLGTVVNGRFRVDEQIAEGGFAVVYRAHQVALDRQVALKVLKTPLGYDERARAEFRDKFATEAKTIARLEHPDIVGVYDFAVSEMPSGDLAPWMALEWVDGETLEARLQRLRHEGRRGLPPREALELLAPAIKALAFAHKQGIVHRDIKPANIMVSEGEHGPRVRVLDFGIAKLMQAEEPAGTGRTRTESVPAFSPAYAAPEQVTFSRTGPWTDVHSLGLILSELLTGEVPFSDPEAAVHEQVMAAARPTPASKGRDVGAFEAVIARALALAPADRYRNAGELLAALEEAARAGSALPAAPAPARASGRRSRTIAALAALVLAAGLLVGSLAWRAHRATGAKTEAARATATATAAPVAPPPAPVPALVAPPPAPAPEERPVPQPAASRRRKADAARAPKPAPSPAKRVDLFDDTK